MATTTYVYYLYYKNKLFLFDIIITRRLVKINTFCEIKVNGKKLDDRYSSEKLISGLKDMNFHKLRGDGFIPSYTRTTMIDELHYAFGFRTDFQIVGEKEMCQTWEYIILILICRLKNYKTRDYIIFFCFHNTLFRVVCLP